VQYPFKTVYSARNNHLKCNARLKVKFVNYKVITFPFISTIFQCHTFKNIYYTIKMTIYMFLARISKDGFDRQLIKYTLLEHNGVFALFCKTISVLNTGRTNQCHWVSQFCYFRPTKMLKQTDQCFNNATESVFTCFREIDPQMARLQFCILTWAKALRTLHTSPIHL